MSKYNKDGDEEKSLLQLRLTDYFTDDNDYDDDKVKDYDRMNNPYQADIVKEIEKSRKQAERERIVTEFLLEKIKTSETKLKNNQKLSYEETNLLVERNLPLLSNSLQKQVFQNKRKMQIMRITAGCLSVMFGSFIYTTLIFFKSDKRIYRNSLITICGICLFYYPFNKTLKLYQCELYNQYLVQFKDDILNPDNYDKKAPIVKKKNNLPKNI
jgi:hypothetical protein